MEVLRIKETDVMLDDYGRGKGKITISNSYGFNYSHYWGSMGCSLKEFLMNINESYFIMKLSPVSDQGKINIKASVRNVRNAIKEEMAWYKYMSLQKELRQEIKRLESCYSDENFIDRCFEISNNIWTEYDCRFEREEFESIVKGVFNEPWHYLEHGDSENEIFLKKLFKQIQKKIKL